MSRHVTLIALCAAVPVVAVVTYTLLEPRTFTAVSAFVPQTRAMAPGGLTALAAQFGVVAPGAEASEGPAFYADLATSRYLLGRLVDEHIGSDSAGSTHLPATSLIDWYDLEGANVAERRAKTVDALREDLDVSTRTGTGVVRIRTSLEDPRLAKQVNDRLLALLNDFNLQNRQTQAGQEREFVEQRMEEVRKDLHEAEDRLAQFMLANREYESSPELRFQYERLSRDIFLQQQLFASLAESHEQARIEEVRNTPVITVVEPPEIPARPDPRYLVLKAVIALFAGASLGVLLTMTKEYVRRARAQESVGAPARV